MLRSLTVRNLVVVEDATLNLSSGLNALIGETGAGKSVLISALATVCGIKSGTLTLRDPSKKAYAEAVFSVPADRVTPDMAEYLDGGDELILSLSVTPKGTISRRINGESVTLQTLRSITSSLVDIHSQRDSVGLYDPQRQLKALDSFGDRKHKKLLEEYQSRLAELKDAGAKIEELRSQVSGEDPDFLRFRISEIEKLNLKPDEIEEDERKLEELSGQAKAKEALESLAQVAPSFYEVATALRSTLSSFSGVGGEMEETAERIRASLSDLQNDLESLEYLQALDDPGLIDRLNQRLFDLDKFRQRYGRRTEDILNALAGFKERLDKLSSFEADMEELKKREEECRRKALEAGKKLSASRTALASKLSKAVCSNLSDLSLPGDGFKVSVQAGDKLLSDGMDRVEFLVDLNGTGKFEPLRKAASGGESSRIMLALKCALSDADPVDLMVFDEIDTGISGSIAFQAGEKLSLLSSRVQVCCVTHLPQVACFADSAFLVEKRGGNSTVRYVSRGDLPDGIQVLLSGSSATSGTIEAARDLVKQADAYREKRD